MSDAVGSIISGATSLVNTGLNALASGLGNKRAFRRAKTMHNIQRQEQLDDMRWNYEMNSPVFTKEVAPLIILLPISLISFCVCDFSLT